MPIQRHNFAGIANACVDLYGVHKFWPKEHRQRNIVTEYASSMKDSWHCCNATGVAVVRASLTGVIGFTKRVNRDASSKQALTSK